MEDQSARINLTRTRVDHVPSDTSLHSAFLSNRTNIIGCDASALPDEDFYHIVVCGCNVYNSVAKGINNGRTYYLYMQLRIFCMQYQYFSYIFCCIDGV